MADETLIANSDVIVLSQSKGAPIPKHDLSEAEVKALPRAPYTGKLPIGDIAIDCAVLEDGRRVVTQRGMVRSLGRHKNPSRGQASVDDRPAFLAAKNLDPFIPEELKQLWAPVLFVGKGGYKGNIAFGYRAEILPMMCNVFLDAHEAGALHRSQEAIIKRCRQLIRGFAIVGIVALIDSATGYERVRDRDELQKILAAYIAPELLPWTRKFPDEFYEQMFRLWGWRHRPISTKRPPMAGKLTADLIYEKLPPGVLEELRRVNPADGGGQRKHKHHQFLTAETGNPHLDKQITIVTALMKGARTRKAFERSFVLNFPPSARQLSLLPEDDDDDE